MVVTFIFKFHVESADSSELEFLRVMYYHEDLETLRFGQGEGVVVVVVVAVVVVVVVYSKKWRL